MSKRKQVAGVRWRMAGSLYGAENLETLKRVTNLSRAHVVLAYKHCETHINPTLLILSIHAEWAKRYAMRTIDAPFLDYIRAAYPRPDIQ